MTTKTQDEQQALSPAQALEKLKMGNARFLTKATHRRDHLSQVEASQKQFPFAAVLSCMDSRGSPEIIFDQGIGDIFAQRLAGNIVNVDVLGGLEFATKVVGSKLIVVLGHTSCGAVTGACEDAKLGNLTELLDKIKPAVAMMRSKIDKGLCTDVNFIDKVAKQNVRNMMQNIKNQSAVIKELVESKQVGIVGAMHDLATGKVTFFDEDNLFTF